MIRTWLLGAVSALAVAAIACDSSTDDDGPGGSGTGTGSTLNPDGCEDAGGVCSCAGSCNANETLADPPLRNQCPQPPLNSGMCTLWCCLPAQGGTGGGGHGGSAEGGTGGSGGLASGGSGG